MALYLGLMFVSLALKTGFGLDTREHSCSYQSCPKGMPAGILNVHIIPHSHDDTGWLKTVEQYYYGSNRARFGGWEENQRAGVQYILDSVLRELLFDKDKTKRFIQVETAFFWRWWHQQTKEMKDMFASLVQNGQIEFVGGGWCMNDEASSYYVDIIHQMSLGLRFLNDTFGHCGVPKAAWQIDPFGHSKEQANLFAEMAFDGLFIGRLDYRDKGKRLSAKSAEMLWSTNHDQSLFTSVLFNTYSPPEGFCWDILCNDEPIRDNPLLHGYNVDRRVNEFVEYVRKQSTFYKTNHVIVTAGMDFHYQAAHSWYTNLDKLIRYTNANTSTHGVHLMYSTPSCYLKAIREETVLWPQKWDDFFPYASDPHAYWTGFFTSRPASKRMIRQAGGILHSAKVLTATRSRWVNMDDNEHDEKSALDGAVENLSHIVAVVQHHDAVTGTEKQHVADDYHLHLDDGISRFFTVAFPNRSFCAQLNISQCKFLESPPERFVISVYNPTAHLRSDYIRLPLPTHANLSSIRVTLVDNDRRQIMLHQILPVPQPVQNIPGREGTTEHELVFYVDILRPLDWLSFEVAFTNNSHAVTQSQISANKVRSKKLLCKGNNKAFFMDDNLRRIERIMDLSSGMEMGFEQEYLHYIPHQGDNKEFEHRASGAYIFRPLNGTSAIPDDIASTQVYDGILFHEIHQIFNDHISQVIRIPKQLTNLYDAEVEWLIGPIPIDDGRGREYVHRLKVKHGNVTLATNGIFFTDANGRQYLERRRHHRPTYDIPEAKKEEPFTSNYYPVTSGIYMQDDHVRLTVLTDRSQGGSSLRDGELELMVHRRLLNDDAFGVGEPLNETAFGQGLVVRGKHYILLDTDRNEANRRMRLLSRKIYAETLLLFGIPLSAATAAPSTSKSSSVATHLLPENVDLLTLEGIANRRNTYLIRLEHLFDVGEHPVMSSEAEVYFREFVDSLGLGESIAWIQETSLGGNLWKDEVSRINWAVDFAMVNKTCRQGNNNKPNETKDFRLVILKPLQIRSFIVGMK